MCGIAGIIDFKHEQSDENLIASMTECLVHRGPDNGSTFRDGACALGHRRLSIIDLSTSANQPMRSPDGNLVMVFNGEIYNYKEIRQDLELSGCTFNTSSDTEVILKGFEKLGSHIFARLNGIFAIAIWNKVRQELYLARDRFGVKPIYFGNIDSGIVFASEAKSILKSGLVSYNVSYQALHEFMYYGNPLGSDTMYSTIKMIRPGTYLRLTSSGREEHVFWNIGMIDQVQVIDDNIAVAKTRQLLNNAVGRQLVSDVPVGVFLSGGIDSSCITALASKHYANQLSTFSCAFDFDMGVNELARAKKVATAFKTNHHELFIEAKNLPEIIIKLIHHHDEPFSDAANIPLYLLTKEASKTHKVILQGDGGDEIFGGYRRYHILSQLNFYRKLLYPAHFLHRFAPELAKMQRIFRMSDAVRFEDDGLKMAALLTVEPMDGSPLSVLSDSLRNKLAGFNPFKRYQELNQELAHLPIVQRMLYIDTQIILPQTFLEKVDKSTMANSVEVRVPLLDNELTDYVMSLPSSMKIRGGEKKWLLKKALRGIVPNEILDGPKRGFSVPYGNWIRKPLKDLLMTSVEHESIRHSDIFNYKELNKKIEEHTSGVRDHGFLLWKIMNLSIWLQQYNVRINDN